MLEPEALAYNNVMFPFLCLGFAICVAFAIAMVELGMKRWRTYYADGSKRTTEPDKISGIEVAITPERENGSGDVQEAQPQVSQGDVNRITYQNQRYVP